MLTSMPLKKKMNYVKGCHLMVKWLECIFWLVRSCVWFLGS